MSRRPALAELQHAVGSATSSCQVLREDPELAEGIEDPRRRAEAVQACVTREVRVPAGTWRRGGITSLDGGIGLLVLDGVLIHRIGIETRFGAEVQQYV